jgi:hypothetical protein
LLSVSPLIVARQRLGKNPPIVARQRLGKNPPFVARQRLGKNSPFVARQRLGRNATAVTNTHPNIENCWTLRFQCGSYRIKESRRLVLPRTSRFIFRSDVVVAVDILSSGIQHSVVSQIYTNISEGIAVSVFRVEYGGTCCLYL